MTDQQLVDLSVQGDQRAFAVLIGRYSTALVTLIRYLIRDYHNANDVLQETLICAWRKLPNLKDVTKIKGWLLKIARSRCYDLNRSSYHRVSPTETEELEIYVNMYGRAPDTEPIENLSSALDEISESDKHLLMMYYFQGLSVSEISEAESWPPGTTKRRLHTARNRLRDKMGRFQYDL